MSRKTKRLSSLIRNTLGQIMLSKMSDPRFDPALTSITRVEVTGDLRTARVYVSVAGDEKTQVRTIMALKHASGYLQDQLMDRVRLRHTPVLEFEIDEAFKRTVETLNLISEIGDELREQESGRQSS